MLGQEEWSATVSAAGSVYQLAVSAAGSVYQLAVAAAGSVYQLAVAAAGPVYQLAVGPGCASAEEELQNMPGSVLVQARDQAWV